MNLSQVASVKWCILIHLHLLLLINCDPQLDLPPINIKPKARPEIYHNSYTAKSDSHENRDDKDHNDDVNGNRKPDASDYDRDRSLRYGPPYFNNDEYDRYAYGFNQNRSYFSHDSQRLNGDDDRYYSVQDIPEERLRNNPNYNNVNNNNYNSNNNNNNYGVYNDNNYRNGQNYGTVYWFFTNQLEQKTKIDFFS